MWALNRKSVYLLFDFFRKLVQYNVYNIAGPIYCIFLKGPIYHIFQVQYIIYYGNKNLRILSSFDIISTKKHVVLVGQL